MDPSAARGVGFTAAALIAASTAERDGLSDCPEKFACATTHIGAKNETPNCCCSETVVTEAGIHFRVPPFWFGLKSQTLVDSLRYGERKRTILK